MKTSTAATVADRTRLSITLRDGRTLSYAVYGPEGGTPFVLFHGTPGSRISMEDELFHELGVKMIYPERPGYGQSSPYPAASFQSWAADTVELLDHLGYDKVAVGGGSGGGPFAMACASLHPHRYTSLSLIASAAPQDLPGYKNGMAFTNKLGYFLSRYTPFLVRSINRSFAKGLKKDPDKKINQLMGQLCEADQQTIHQMKEEGTYHVLVDHLLEAYANGVEGHLSDMKIISRKWDIAYQAIKCPIYIWHGEDDTLAPVLGAKALANFLPNATASYIPNAGHLLMENLEVLRGILGKVK